MFKILRHLIRFVPKLPQQAAFALYNYIIGYVMFYVRSSHEEGQKLIGTALSILWMVNKFKLTLSSLIKPTPSFTHSVPISKRQNFGSTWRINKLENSFAFEILSLLIFYALPKFWHLKYRDSRYKGAIPCVWVTAYSLYYAFYLFHKFLLCSDHNWIALRVSVVYRSCTASME